MDETKRSNPELFEEAVARVLAEVYASFPVPIHLRVAGLNPVMTEEESRIYASTVDWLGSEGFLKMGNSAGPATDKHFANVTLTLFGLTVLGQVPKALQVPGSPGPSIGQELLQAMKTEAIGTAVGLAKEAVLQGGMMALRAMTGQ